MSSVNKVILIGNLGADPEIKHLDNGKIVASFSVATNEKWKDSQGNQKEATEWHTVEAWGRLAEVAEKYLQKGSKVYIEGKIKTDQWENSDGETRYKVKISCVTFQMLSSNTVSNVSSSNATLDDETDSLPF